MENLMLGDNCFKLNGNYAFLNFDSISEVEECAFNLFGCEVLVTHSLPYSAIDGGLYFHITEGKGGIMLTLSPFDHLEDLQVRMLELFNSLYKSS